MMGNSRLHFNIRTRAMTDDSNQPEKVLPPAAQRALAEAEARRKATRRKPPLPKEIGGRGGEEPVRYGDWEVKGIASDF
jgi:hypothetical protein